MQGISRTQVALSGREDSGEDVYSATIFANELSRDGVSVDLEGMDFSNYLKNPVVLYAHDYMGRTESGGLPIGRTLSLERAADGRVRAEFQFMSGDPFADRVRNAWRQGFLRGASIGWRAIESRPDESGYGVRVSRSELLEWSIVAVPADPDALREAHSRVMSALIRADDAPQPDAPSADFGHTRMMLEELRDALRPDAAAAPECRDPPSAADPHSPQQSIEATHKNTDTGDTNEQRN